jgi:hypothetical protein
MKQTYTPKVSTVSGEFTQPGAPPLHSIIAQGGIVRCRPVLLKGAASAVPLARHRNQGIGGLLLRAAEEWGRSHGADFASLDYLTVNAPAAAFYHLRMGYRAAATIAIKPL